MPDPAASVAEQATRRVLLIDADSALLELLQEWLGGEGCRVMREMEGADHGPFDLLLVDVPFPRHADQAVLRRVARAYPGVPVLALSSSFFAGVEAGGAVARSLGVAGVLPKPLSREALLAAVRRLVRDRAGFSAGDSVSAGGAAA